jgi:hypothetical protein
VLPTLYLLGVFTFVRLVECSAEDFRLSGHDDGLGVFANVAVPAEGRTQYFTFGSVVAVINSVVGGSAVTLLRSAGRLLDARTGGVEPLFPSSGEGGIRTHEAV